MERWEGSTHRRARQPAVETKRYPSFSSSLLDAIYRSIDEGDGDADVNRAAPNRARNRAAAGEITDLCSARRCFTATAAESKKIAATCTTGAVSGKVVLRRRDYGGTAEYDRRPQSYWRELQQRRERNMINSTSSSSESSNGGFSSSEAESVRMKPAKSTGRPSQITETRRPRKESVNSIKSRFRASKIYGELKKARAPVSPGGRLASFITHLFASPGGHLKKVKTSPAVPGTGGDESTCSSASSFSRSCLSKTPSSSRPDSGAKRSVRFYPVGAGVDDDLRPCGQKSAYDDHVYDGFDLSSLPPLPPVRLKNPTPAKQGIQELALGLGHEVNTREEEEDDDDDAASYSSSDLFELENLTAVGGDELPVYETTHLHTNRAIAQGLLV